MLGALALGQNSAQPKAELIHRYERGCGYSCNQELAIDLGGGAGTESDDIIAIRFCSKEPLSKALAFAASPPDYVISILKDTYKYTPERILLLRSNNCLSTNPAVAATEYWVIHKGGDLPSYIESVKSCQVDFGSLGRRGANARNYKAALHRFPQTLKANPNRFGMVLGYYLKRPNRSLKQRLNEAKKFLERSGLPQNRYIISLKPWTGEYGSDPPEPEPKYPDIAIIEVSEECKR
jgi:hypothetical protein